jgi:hypothetical protein
MQYYFQYKTPSNLGSIQFGNVGFRKKLERCTFREFKAHINFSMGKICHISSSTVFYSRTIVLIIWKFIISLPYFIKNTKMTIACVLITSEQIGFQKTGSNVIPYQTTIIPLIVYHEQYHSLIILTSQMKR